LDDNVAVQYKKEYKDYEKNLEWGYGCFQAINVQKLDETFLTYDREKLMEILKNCPNKTNEKTTQEIYEKNGGKIFFKDFNKMMDKNNQFNLSDKATKDSMDYWTVPFYNTKEDKVSIIVWNNKDDKPINVNFIINNDKMITFNNLNKFEWRMGDIGNINDINSILILVNNKIKTNIILNKEKRELFKITNHTQFN
jgi:asparagine N-glycosylation enzyme membrane subunit Stt3